MSFLAPFALALAAAAIVPLLLHLRRRRVACTVVFPAARYLARATRDHERTLRARSSLLAALRILLILVLALAAARPLARFGTGHGKAAIVIVLDNSLSTGAVSGGRAVLDDEKDAARAVVDAASADDRLVLVTADRTTITADIPTLRAVVDTLHPLAARGDVAGALRAATGIAQATPDMTAAIVVLTDGQATTWRGVTTHADVLWTPTAPPPANGAVLSAEPHPARWSGRGTIHVVARAAAATDTLPLRVELDEQVVARGSAIPAADGLAQADIPVSSPPAGWSRARVAMSTDELPADDARWVALYTGAAPRVGSSAGPFADRAIEALAAAGVVLTGNDIAVTPAPELARLPALITAPLDPGRVGAANRALERVGVPWRFGAERRDLGRVRGDSISGVDVRQRFALVAAGAAPAETLATVGAEPWIVAGDRYVLVGSALDTAATTFPAAPSFVPWLARMVGERLAEAGSAALAAAPGAKVAVPARVDSVELADGTRAAVRDSLTLPQRAGVYFWVRAGARIGAVVANAESEESDLTRVRSEALARQLDGAHVAHTSRAVAAATFGAASRRPLGTILLGLAVLLLIAEAVVAGRFASLLPRRAGATA